MSFTRHFALIKSIFCWVVTRKRKELRSKWTCIYLIKTHIKKTNQTKQINFHSCSTSYANLTIILIINVWLFGNISVIISALYQCFIIYIICKSKLVISIDWIRYFGFTPSSDCVVRFFQQQRKFYMIYF